LIWQYPWEKCRYAVFHDIADETQNKPGKIVTSNLRSYYFAQRELILEPIHDNDQYANNRAELSHQTTRMRERGIRKFKSVKQTRRFPNFHAAACNLLNLDILPE
jgi:putative transposase